MRGGSEQMYIEEAYKKIINNMSLVSLEKEKEALLNAMDNLDILENEFQILINKLELVYKTSLLKFEQTNIYKVSS